MVKQWLLSFLPFVLIVLACTSQPYLNPTVLAQKYVAANSVPMRQEFSSFVLSDDRTPEGLTRDVIESRVKWQYSELTFGRANTPVVSVTVIASADIHFENQRVNATLPFNISFDRRTGLAQRAAANPDASLAKIQVTGLRSTPTATERPKAPAIPVVSEGISRELTDAISECVWDVAHTVEPPALPEAWLTHPQMMEYLRTMEMDTPERLHDAAKWDVEGLTDFGDYSEVAYLVMKGSGVSHALTMHYLFCKDYWQGLEAAEVAGHDDAIAAVAECSWQIARSEELPIVPDGVGNLTQYELKTEAQGMVGLSLNASLVDAGFRAHIDDGSLPAEIVTGDWHRVFCGGEWAGAE